MGCNMTAEYIVANGIQIENISSYNNISNTYDVLCIYELDSKYYELSGVYDCTKLSNRVVDSITSIREVEKVFITESAWKYLKV